MSVPSISVPKVSPHIAGHDGLACTMLVSKDPNRLIETYILYDHPQCTFSGHVQAVPTSQEAYYRMRACKSSVMVLIISFEFPPGLALVIPVRPNTRWLVPRNITLPRFCYTIDYYLNEPVTVLVPGSATMWTSIITDLKTSCTTVHAINDLTARSLAHKNAF